MNAPNVKIQLPSVTRRLLTVITHAETITYVDLCTRFEAVAKRVIDDALDDLVAKALVVCGSAQGGMRVYAPTRVARAVTPSDPGKPPLQARIRGLVATVEGPFKADDILDALDDPDVELSTATSYLAQMAREGRTRRVAKGTYERVAEPNTPSEASSDGASGEASPTAEEPAAVATPKPAGDAPADSAPESPPPAMGPGEASASQGIDTSWPGALSPPSAEAREAVEVIVEFYEKVIPLAGAVPPMSDEDEIEIEEPDEDEELAENTAVFAMRGPDLDIRIEGAPSKVMLAVTALDTHLRGAS